MTAAGDRVMYQRMAHYHLAKIVAGASLLLSLAGCGKGNAENQAIVDKYRAAVEARLATARTIGASLASLPELTADRVTLTQGKVVLRPTHEAIPTDTAMMEEGANLPILPGIPSYTLMRAGHLGTCAKLLKEPVSEKASQQYLNDSLGLCANAKYLFVVRIVKQIDAKVVPGQNAFIKGETKGEIRVFDMSNGKDLGGYRFSAKNSDHVSYKGDQDKSAVASDLTRETQAAINAVVNKLIADN